MEKHHREAIDNLILAMKKDDAILALILGGSLAHGFEEPGSDIDVTLLVSSDELERRRRENKLHYNNRELCAYPGGYIDGKYADLDFLNRVAERGSDPARFAFQGNRVLFSKVEGIPDLLKRIARFPIEKKAERLERFAAQALNWRWYFGEGARRDNRYLLALGLHKTVLFAGRMVLTVNELLYPYHKWLLRVLADAPRRPAGFMEAVAGLLEGPTVEKVEALVRLVFDFALVDFEAADARWPTLFMKDSELNWLDGEAPIDDI